MRKRGKKYRNVAYNYSSEAYQLATEYDYSTGRRGRTPRVKKKTVGVRAMKAKEESFIGKLKAIKVNYSMMRILIGAFIIFVYAMAIVNVLAVGSEQKNEYAVLKDELAQIKENNIYLETQLAENLDLEKVEKIAEKKLGMQKPAAHQIVYINVPKQSYTVQYAQNDNSSEAFGLTKIIEDFLED